MVSSNHPVRPGQYFLRYRYADPLCRLEIDHHLEFRRLLHREVGRLGSLKDLVHVRSDAPVDVRAVSAVGHEYTGFYSFPVVVD